MSLFSDIRNQELRCIQMYLFNVFLVIHKEHNLYHKEIHVRQKLIVWPVVIYVASYGLQAKQISIMIFHS